MFWLEEKYPYWLTKDLTRPRRARLAWTGSRRAGDPPENIPEFPEARPTLIKKKKIFNQRHVVNSKIKQVSVERKIEVNVMKKEDMRMIKEGKWGKRGKGRRGK